MTSTRKFDPDDPRLSAYVLNELEGDERAAVETLLREDEGAAAFVAGLRETSEQLGRELGETETLAPEQRASIERAIAEPVRRPRALRRFVKIAAAAAIALSISAAMVMYVMPKPAETAPFAYHAFGGAPSTGRALSAPSDARGRPALVSELNALGYGDAGPQSPTNEVALRALGYLGDDSPAQETNSRRLLDALGYADPPERDTESYRDVQEPPFTLATTDARSTFSIDVDTASYANLRRFVLREQRLPPAASVRIEELINYFRYDYAEPEGDLPFSVTTEVGSSPWAPERRLVRVGLRAQDIAFEDRPASNLVFLVDVSGSMNDPRKLPLLQRSMKMLVEQLDERDSVSIVVYASATGLVLPPTSCDQGYVVMEALDRLRAGGSTNGGDGIRLAYRTAREAFIRGGINRVILCTDGDFNVGVTRHDDLMELIEGERESGVFLSVLGFGTGNLKDSTMEQLADKGNGNYSYIDSIAEARKVLVSEMGGTLQAVAKDVKIQVEFNPAEVQAWRLIGYENRTLAHQDFNDDTKDAGEIGAGHTVTALYEVLPHGVALNVPQVDPSRYQSASQPTGDFADELLFVKLRYKPIGENESRLIEQPVRDTRKSWHETTNDFRFVAAVAAFGMKVRHSIYTLEYGFDQIVDLAARSLGDDDEGYRREFLEIAKTAERIDGR